MNKPESDGVIWNHAQLLNPSGNHCHLEIDSSKVIFDIKTLLKSKENWDKWVSNQIEQIDSMGLNELIEEEYTTKGRTCGLSTPEISMNFLEEDGAFHLDAQVIIELLPYYKPENNENFLRELLKIEIDDQFFIDIHLVIDYFSEKFFNELLEHKKVRSITISNGGLPGTVAGGKYSISHEGYYVENGTKPYYANLNIVKNNCLYEDPLVVFDDQLSLLAELAMQEGLVDFKIFDASLIINKSEDGDFDYSFCYNIYYDSRKEFIDVLIPHFPLCGISTSTTSNDNAVDSKTLYLVYIVDGEPDQRASHILRHNNFLITTAQKFNLDPGGFETGINNDSSSFLRINIENIQEDAFITEILSNATNLHDVQIYVNSESNPQPFEEQISFSIPGTVNLENAIALLNKKIDELTLTAEKHLSNKYSFQYPNIFLEFDNNAQKFTYLFNAVISYNESSADFVTAMVDEYETKYMSVQGKI